MKCLALDTKNNISELPIKGNSPDRWLVIHQIGGWWQQMPSELRCYIIIDGKKTCEYDYSQLKPHMVYFLLGKELGDEDAHGRVIDGEHRPLVEGAFNAMMQASTQLTQ